MTNARLVRIAQRLMREWELLALIATLLALAALAVAADVLNLSY